MAANSVTMRGLAAAVLATLLTGCAIASASPNAPTASAPDAAVLLAEYRAARDAICRVAAADASPVPNEDLLAIDVLYDPTMSAEHRANSIEAVRALASRFDATVDRLESIDPPPQVNVEHIASVTRARDVVTLLGRLADYLGTGEVTAAHALDEAIGMINVKIEAFETTYELSPCP